MTLKIEQSKGKDQWFLVNNFGEITKIFYSRLKAEEYLELITSGS